MNSAQRRKYVDELREAREIGAGVQIEKIAHSIKDHGFKEDTYQKALTDDIRVFREKFKIV
jgi:hypothetical protein